MKCLLENIPYESNEILRTFSHEIEKKITERYSSLRMAYRHFDTNKDGLISESEFI